MFPYRKSSWKAGITKRKKNLSESTGTALCHETSKDPLGIMLQIEWSRKYWSMD